MKMIKQLTLSQIFGAVEKQRVKSAFTFVAVAALVALLFLIWPRYYGSQGKLFVKIDQRQTDGTSNESKVAIQAASQSETNSVVQLVKSRGVVEAVVDKVGPAAILEHSFFDWANQKMSFLGDSWNQDSLGMKPDDFRQLSERERAANKLESLLDITVAEDSNMISIFSLAPSSVLAQKICDQVMKVSQERYLQINESPRSGHSVKNQLDRQRKNLLAAEKRLGKFRNDNGFLSIDHATALLGSKLEQVDSDLMATSSDLIQVSAQLTEIDTARRGEQASLEARLAALEKKQSQLKLELQDINSKRPTALAYQREADEAAGLLAQSTAAFNQSKQAGPLFEKELVVAQPANFLVKHVSPRGSYILPIGMVLAGILAILTALYFERDLLSGSLRVEEVEEILQMSVLVSLPKVASQKNMVGKTIA